MFNPTNLMGRLAFVTAGLLGMFNCTSVVAATVSIQNGTADFSQTGYTPAGTYDNNLTTGWGVAGQVTSNKTAVWEAVNDVVAPGGSNLTFTLIMGNISPQHTFRHFRLSVTGDHRDNFADGVFPTGGDISAAWIELTPLTVSITGGASYSINGDNSILVSGTNPNISTYTVTATSALTTITGFRVEVFGDAVNRVGRSGTGNFTLEEFQVDAVPTPEPSSAVLLLIGFVGLRRIRRVQGC